MCGPAESPDLRQRRDSDHLGMGGGGRGSAASPSDGSLRLFLFLPGECHTPASPDRPPPPQEVPSHTQQGLMRYLRPFLPALRSNAVLPAGQYRVQFAEHLVMSKFLPAFSSPPLHPFSPLASFSWTTAWPPSCLPASSLPASLPPAFLPPCL